MENNERDRKLEQWLDEALSEYSAAEPRFGLEQRVLTRVRSEEKVRAKRWSFWKWMPAFAAIAAAIIVGVAILPVARQKASFAKQASVQSETAAQKENSQVAGLKEPAPSKKELVVRGKKNQEAIEKPEAAFAKDRNVERDSVMIVDRRDAGAASNQFAINGAMVRPAPVAPPPPPTPASPTETAIGGAMNQPSAAASTREVDGLAKVQRDASQTTAKQTVEMQTGLESTPARSYESVILAEDSKGASQTAPTGIISTEAVTVARETPALKRMKKDKKEKERAAQDRAGDAAFAGAFGTVVRTEIKQLPAGPMQFPTPSPLSEQEKLVLAAAKKLKDAPKQDPQGGSIAPVEIKDVQIAPLEAPKK